MFEKGKAILVFIKRFSFKIFVRVLWRLLVNIIFYFLAFFCGSIEVIWFWIKQNIFKNRLPNYFIVDDKALYRGGQPSTAGLKELTQKGIKTIINLRLGNFNEKVIQEYKEDRIRMIHLPFSPNDPQDSIMIEFLKILINPCSRPAFVHCFHGADRTGAVCAIYRIIVQNWDKERAIAEMKKRGLHWWHTNLIDYIHNLNVERIREMLFSDPSFKILY